MISTTAARCCSTSASPKLSQNPFGPSGQFSGSARKNKNTAKPRNINGQILAHEKYRLRERSASIPSASTINPAQLWLYSDQAMSLGLSGCHAVCPGIYAGGKLCPDASAFLYICLVGSDNSFRGGLESLGARGVNRAAISCNVTRSSVRSAPGGCEVSEAAARMIVRPMPISASPKRSRLRIPTLEAEPPELPNPFTME